MTRLTSTRYQISYIHPTLRDEPADVPADIERLVNAIELSARYAQGTLAARPAAAIVGRIYYATDQAQLYWDTGSAWVTIGPPAADSITDVHIADNVLSKTGTFAARPLGNSVPAGTIYFANDTIANYRSDGAAWQRMDSDVAKVDHFAVAPTSGWTRADGSQVTVATTAKSDLRAALALAGNPFGTAGGNPLVPNLKGRVVVDQDTTQVEFDAVGEAAGAKTHTLGIGEMPSHSHSVNSHNHGGGDHGHQINVLLPNGVAHSASGGDYEAPNQSGIFTANSGAIIASEAPGTNTQGSSNAHNNLQPYIVLPAYVKL